MQRRGEKNININEGYGVIKPRTMLTPGHEIKCCMCERRNAFRV
jgi:hypothetical protein